MPALFLKPESKAQENEWADSKSNKDSKQDKNIKDYMLEMGQLTQLGLYLLHHYYTQKHPSLQRFKVIYSPADILLLDTITSNETSGDDIWGFTHNLDGHKTPIIKKGDKYVVLDSKGLEGPYLRDIVARIKTANQDKPVKIYYATPARQMDNVSCGTDALMVLKAALHMGDKLFDFIESTEPELDASGIYRFEGLPAEIAKMSQLKSFLVRRSIYEKKGIFDRFPAEMTRQITINKNKGNSLETALEYAQRHASPYDGDANTAVVERREKFRKLLTKMIAEIPAEKLDAMGREASGLNLILQNPAQLAVLFRPATGYGLADEIYEAMGIRRVTPVTSGKIVAINFGVFSTREKCTALLQKVTASYQQQERKFLDGDRKVTLRDLAKLVYAIHVIKDKLSKHQAAEANVAPVQRHSSPASPTLRSGN